METDRPPSERTPELLVLDRLEELAAKIDDIPKAIVVSSWWDQLPAETAMLFGGMVTMQGLTLPRVGPNQVDLYVNVAHDRLELKLLVNGSNIIWQRALFFGRPPSVS